MSNQKGIYLIKPYIKYLKHKMLRNIMRKRRRIGDYMLTYPFFVLNNSRLPLQEKVMDPFN